MEKVIIGMMMAVVMVLVLSQVVQGMVPQPTPPAPGAFTCPYCGQTFDTLQELVDHVASEHPDEPPIQPIDIGWD